MFLWLRKYLERVRERGEPYYTPFSLRLTNDGFQVIFKETQRIEDTIRWDDIIEIRTYKRDCFSYDKICLLFIINRHVPTEIAEGFEGFIEISEQMCRHFPTISADWYSDVMLPAFATNDTRLYFRQD